MIEHLTNNGKWEAKAEESIQPNELLAEIEPLLKDYFVGKVTLDERCISYFMPNGQKFMITAQEV